MPRLSACTIKSLALCLTLGTLGTACDEDLPKATLVERMRVLGARVEVVDDEARSTPRPGERVRLTLPLAFPSVDDDASGVETMLIQCTTPSQFTGGLPICQEFIDAARDQAQSADIAAALDARDRFACGDVAIRRFDYMGVTLACLDGEPSTELKIPDSFEAESALYLGIVCEDGRPFFDINEPTLFGCDGDPDKEGIQINGQIPVVKKAAEENDNPSLAPLVLLMDRGAWPVWDEAQERPPTNNCVSAARREVDDALRVADIGDHEITIRYEADAREDDPDGEPELLELTVFATEGEMERRFTVFDEMSETVRREGPDGVKRDYFEETLEWDPGKPDEELGRGGKLVRFYVTLRDGRGGFDLQTRMVCLR